MVRVPTPDEENAKRIHPERESLVQERMRIENRIEALLFTQGFGKGPRFVRGSAIFLSCAGPKENNIDTKLKRNLNLTLPKSRSIREFGIKRSAF
jgi:transposase